MSLFLRHEVQLKLHLWDTSFGSWALSLLSPVYICVLLLPQYIYKFSQSHRTHKVVSESRHPHHHPWFAFPLILYWNFLHSLNSATSHPSACPASRIIWGFHLLSSSLSFSSFIFLLLSFQRELGATVGSLPCLTQSLIIGISICWLHGVRRQRERKQYLPLIPEMAMPTTSPSISQLVFFP